MRTQINTFEATIFNRITSAHLHSDFGAFRKGLFIDTLNWKLKATQNQEYDEFDTANSEYLILRQFGEIVAGFRAIRCDHPYLAETKFPQLAGRIAYPKTSEKWEISRLGVDPRKASRLAGPLLYALMIRFAQKRRAQSLVAFTTLAHEKNLDLIQVPTIRFGDPVCIGTDAKGHEMTVVAGEIPLSRCEGFLTSRVFEMAKQIELEDEVDDFRHSSISA